MVTLFLDSDIPAAIAELTRLEAAIPETLAAALPATAKELQDAFVPVVQAVTPVGKTGQLRDQTQGGEIRPSDDGLSATIISDAANETSGYHYAGARAFGHVIANQYGTYGSWTPPEDPVYPVQAVLDGGSVIDEAVGGVAAAVRAGVIVALH